MSDAPKPTGLIAKSGLELLTFGTPNGHKIHLLLEELKAEYGLEYTYQSINIMQNIQKEPWFTKLGPNGRIPVLVDHDKGGHSVMEGSAILAYLERFYDPKKIFDFDEQSLEHSKVEQWVAWQHGGLGPMQGQANHFFRFTKERIPYPTQRYVGETQRLFGVLDIQLKNRDYLVGPGRGKYTIADIASFSWVNWSLFAGVDHKKWPNLHAWWKRINERPATQKGVNIPNAPMATNDVVEKKLAEDAEFKKNHDGLQEALTKAQEEFSWKYSAP